MISLYILFVLLFQKCIGFDLDDVTYDKMPPLFALDDYDRCLLYNGTYCVIRTDLFAEPDHELMNLMKSYSKSTHVTHYNYTYLNKGICLTTTCRDFVGDKNLTSHSDLHEILETCENHTYYDKYGLQAKVSKDFYCDTNETKVDKKDLLDWMVLAVFLLIILVNVTATLYDSSLEGKTDKKFSTGEKMLLCFSIKRNWKFLLAPANTDPKMAKLEGIQFIRTAASFIMVLGHVMWIFTMGFIDNTHDFERSYHQVHIKLMYNGMTIVQVFFVVSGFLLIYNLESAAEEKRVNIKALPIIFLHRFFRLAPPIAVLLAFSSTWVRFMGTGPLWKRYVFSVVHDCRKWWWSHLLFINNYLTDNKYCAIQTWHTAADTQVFLVGITVYFLVRPRARATVACLFLLISLLLPALHVYFYDLDAQLLKTPEMLRSLDNPNRYPYVFAHNNIICFLLGMVTAYKLYRWQKQGVVFNGKIARFLFKSFIPLIVLSFYGGSFFHEEDYRSPLWVRMLYQSTHRLFVGLPIVFCLVSLGMEMDNGFNNMMKWPVFRVTGKLTYSVFLLHEIFTHIVAGSKSNLEHFSYLNLMIYQFGIVGLTYVLSLPFYLMIEAPMTPLLKVMLMKQRADDASNVIPVPTKNFVADVIRSKRKRVGENTVEKVDEKETIVNGKEPKDNIINALLENAAKEDAKEKLS